MTNMLVYAHIRRARKRYAVLIVETRCSDREQILRVRYRKSGESWQCKGGSLRADDGATLPLASAAAQSQLLDTIEECRVLLKMRIDNDEVDDYLARIDPSSSQFLE